MAVDFMFLMISVTHPQTDLKNMCVQGDGTNVEQTKLPDNR